MARYQIRFFVLGSVQCRMGTRVVVAPHAALAMLVEEDPDGLVTLEDTPVSRKGTVVRRGRWVTLATVEAVPRHQRFELLEFAGGSGVVGPVPPITGLELQVSALEPAEGSDDAVQGVPALDAPPRPRRSALSLAVGTRIDTFAGTRPIETLVPGDLVSTLDNGSQPLRWIGSRHVTPEEMAMREDLRPVLVEAMVLGNAAPIMVSPRHRFLLNDWRAQVYFGEDQVLIPALALINGGSVRQITPEAGVTYMHVLFDRHEVILAEGTLSESLHPGEAGLSALDPAQRREVEALFPGHTVERRRSAFPIVRMSEARALRLPG